MLMVVNLFEHIYEGESTWSKSSLVANLLASVALDVIDFEDHHFKPKLTFPNPSLTNSTFVQFNLCAIHLP